MEFYKINDNLQHHGVKGMKWGVRRYQNKDGSLTPLGQRRSTNKDIKNYKKSISTQIEDDVNSKYKKELNALEREVKNKYTAYAKKHKLIDESEDPEGFWEDYDKRHEIYDKGYSISKPYDKRRAEIDAIIGKEIANKMVERYGQERIDKYNKSERTKANIAIGTAATAAILATAPLSVPVIAVAGVAVGANKVSKAIKKKRA